MNPSMNYPAKIKQLLLPFYFGAISDGDRLVVERELLVDSEVLVDYLDLKRSIEAASAVPQQASNKVWYRLSQNMTPKKKFLISLSLGTALAAGIAICAFLFLQNKPEPTAKSGILFDSGRELSSGSNVL